MPKRLWLPLGRPLPERLRVVHRPVVKPDDLPHTRHPRADDRADIAREAALVTDSERTKTKLTCERDGFHKRPTPPEGGV